MFDLIGSALAFFYDLTGSYGLSIMLLTLGIMILLTPLTLKGTRSMIAMQRLQPEMKRLQSKYKDDRQKLNEEMMKFYKENNINPVGGCLPLILQMPVFFVLYRVLYGLTNPAPFATDFGRLAGAVATNPAATVANYGTFQPDHLDPSSAMFMDLSQVREMGFVGLDLARSAIDVFQSSVVGFLPYLVLIITIGVTTWYQQRQIQGRNPNMASSNPQQQMIMKVMPFFLPAISLTLPAGVVLYFLVSNLYRIGQQAFITRTMYRDEHGAPIEITPPASDDADEKPKGLMAQLREMADPGNASNGGNGSSKGSRNGAGKGAKPTSGAKGRGSSRQARKGKAAPKSGNKAAKSSGNGKGSSAGKGSGRAKAGATKGSGGGQKGSGTKKAGQPGSSAKGSPGKSAKGSPGRSGGATKGSPGKSGGASKGSVIETSGSDQGPSDGGADGNGDDDATAASPTPRTSEAPSRRPPSGEHRSKSKKKRR